MRLLRRLADTTMPPVALSVLVAVVWHLFVVGFKLPIYLVPGPVDVWSAARDHARELWSAVGLTAAGAVCGFLLSFVGGSLIAFVFSQSRLVQRACYPYAIFLQTVPIVAIAPLIVIWFGTGFKSVVLVSLIIGLFPIITNGTAGLTTLDRELVELFEVNDASRWQTLWKLRLPSAVPYLVTGARISSGLSVIGAIVGEFFAGYGSERYGLGYLIMLTSGQIKTAYLFAAVLSSTLLGLAIFGVVNVAGQAILSRWQED